jgi:hypothetical protein
LIGGIQVCAVPCDHEGNCQLSEPNADIPANLRYKSLCFLQCNAYRSFLENFRHGVVISSWPCIAPYGFAEIFVEGIVNGSTWQKIEQDMDAVIPNIHDPSVGRGAFELSIF